MYRKFAVFALMSQMLMGCSTPTAKPAGNALRISMPASAGWYADQRVFYITPDISDAGMGQMTGANFAPRLRDAVPSYPKAPGTLTVLERVYKFPGGEQDAVFASAPAPIGPQSHDTAYSPLWLLFAVKWSATATTRVLTKEAAILTAQENAELSIERTNIVINCPIVATASGEHLPGVVFVK